MALNSPDSLANNVRKNELQIAGLLKIINQPGGINDLLASHSQDIYSLLATRTNAPPVPVANLLWNGELGHSAHTWNDTATTVYTADKNRECAWFYAHMAPVDPQTFTTISTANVIPLPSHGFTTGTPVDFITTGTLPTGISLATTYYVISLTVDTISIATSLNNALAGTVRAITSGSGSGTHTIQEILIGIYTDQPVVGSTTNNELKTTAHTTYHPQLSRWNSTNGWAEVTGTSSVDALLPSNFVDATTPLARVGLICARKNQFIELSATNIITAGIWDNTSGQRKFLPGQVGFAASLIGTPDPAGITRQFAAFLTSDRGYQILSSVITITNTPATLDSLNYITMSWGQQAGQLQVDLYEYVPSLTEYRLIGQVSAATSFIYEGDYIAVVPGYPTPTQAERNATYPTSAGELTSLAINAVSGSWNTVILPIGVPENYNKGNTTDHQWLRIWLSEPPNLLITGVVSNGTGVLSLPDGAINSDTFANGGYCGSLPATAVYTTGGAGQSPYIGLVVQVYDVDNTLIATTTISQITSNTSITLADNIAAATGRRVRIIGGGFHGLFIDKIHLGFQLNTSYAPNSMDARTLQPLAAPSSSNQGGSGSGGGGGVVCIAGTTPVKMHAGNWKMVKTARPGYLWAAGGLKPNTLLHLKPGFSLVRGVRSANGCYIECTDTEKFITTRTDIDGTALRDLQVGDPVMVEIDDMIIQTTIAEITPYLGSTDVYTPTLSDNHQFIAGELRLPWWTRLAARIFDGKISKGGFLLHNSKPIEDPT